MRMVKIKVTNSFCEGKVKKEEEVAINKALTLCRYLFFLVSNVITEKLLIISYL